MGVVRASAGVRSPPLSTPPPAASPSSRVCCCSLPKPPSAKSSSQLKHHHLSVSFLSASSTLLAIVSPPLEARAVTLPKDQIVSSITEVEKTIDQVQQATSGFLDSAQKIFQVVSEAVKPGIDAAVPVLQQAGDEALKFASPALSEASKKAQEAMQSSGLDTQPVMSAAKSVAEAAEQTSKVIEGAKPIASSAVETISSSDPIVIVGTAGVLFITYLIIPPLWSAITFNLRGYKGGLSPAQTLELICTQNYTLIDIRSEKDKDKAGIPRLPSTAKNRMVAIPLEELPSKLKGIVRSAKKVEAEIAALKISYLKKINKGSNIVILDSYSDSAKIVARTLTTLGFKNTFIVQDGFSGSKGWLQSRLGTDSYNFSFAEILSPSRIIPAGRFRTTKLLPGSE